VRDPKRIDRILGRIGRIWKAMPDLRLSQLLANANTDGRFDKAFYYEDDKLEADLAKLESYLRVETT
jgi:uncharacterized protein YihD (DUF1040 family)